MKNILIVTYFFEPYNIVATRRPVSWANYLSAFYNVIVVTRSWTGKENGLKDISIENSDKSTKILNPNLEVIHLPFLIPEKRGFTPRNWLLIKLNSYYRFFFRKFSDIEYIEENFEAEIQQLVKARNIDLIIYTCNPFLFLNISKRIYKITGIKYIIDFRDLVGERMLLKKMNPKEIIYNEIMLFRLRSLIRPAAALITVSEPINIILSGIFSKKVYTIYNGFDKELFSNLQSIKEDEKIFTITYAGNIYPEQNFNLFLKGASQFFIKCDPNAQLQFIGISKKYKDQIESFQDTIKLKFIDWMPHKEALESARQSSVLLFFGWKGFSGIMSGKIFDYLGLKRTILLAPSDEDVLEQLLISTGSGLAPKTSDEVAKNLEDLYRDWEEKGNVTYKGNIESINEYTRENQAKKLLHIINNVI